MADGATQVTESMKGYLCGANHTKGLEERNVRFILNDGNTWDGLETTASTTDQVHTGWFPMITVVLKSWIDCTESQGSQVWDVRTRSPQAFRATDLHTQVVEPNCPQVAEAVTSGPKLQLLLHMSCGIRAKRPIGDLNLAEGLRWVIFTGDTTNTWRIQLIRLLRPVSETSLLLVLCGNQGSRDGTLSSQECRMFYIQTS